MTDFASNHLRKGAPRPADAVDRIGPHHAPHQMRDAFEIAATLEGLAQSGEAVTVYPPGRIVAMARIDEVMPEDGCFTLDLADGDLVLAEGKTTLVASLGGNAKIQFELEADWNVVPGRPHLTRLPLPALCQVLNRRAEARLETPVGVNYSARFTTLGKVFELPLHDFSGGGVGMRATPEQAYELYVGKKLDGVQLDLGPSLRIVADLEVRLLRPFRTFLLGQQVQIGCRIAQIAMQMRQGLDRAVTTVQKRR